MMRPATADDSAAIEAIVQAAYAPYIERIGQKPGPMLEDYPQRVEDGGVHVLDHAGQVQGFVILKHTDTALLLDNLAVAPHAQGLGLGDSCWILPNSRHLMPATVPSACTPMR